MEAVFSSELLKRVLDESEFGIIVTDLDGTIMSVSEKAVALTGYSERDLIGSTPRTFRSGQTPPAQYKDLWETIQRGQTWKGAILNRRKDGSLFLDRETIVSGNWPGSGRPCFVALHRNASVEMDLRLKVARADARLSEVLEEIERTKSDVRDFANLPAENQGSAADALVAALEARNPYTAGHGRRTCAMMELVGSELGLFFKHPIGAIRTGAILHDIGKVGIPDSILLKQGRLTEHEFEVMKSHTTIGFEILHHALHDETVLRMVRSHHERLDGSGYPDGLKGSEIPDYVRAFSVCDCFDAMTCARSYRPAMPAEDAISILTDDALIGRLDMSAVEALRRLWKGGGISDARTTPADRLQVPLTIRVSSSVEAPQRRAA